MVGAVASCLPPSALASTNPTTTTMDFENVTLPNIDFCTSKQNPGLGNDWITSYETINGFSSNVLKYSYHPNYSANAWFYTQGIQLTAGENYTITYKYGNNSPNYSEKLNVSYGTSPQAASMTSSIAQHVGITGGQPSTELITFTAPTTDVFYFGFQAFSAADQNQLFLDDISIYLAPTCPASLGLNAGAFTTSSATLTWTAGGAETEWDVIYGAKGFSPTTGGTIVNVNGAPQTTITNLNVGTEYDYYVRAVCSTTDSSTLIGPKTFGTSCVETNLPYLEDFESATIPELPICTSRENLGGGNDWESFYYFNNGFTGNVLVYSFNMASPAIAWFYTQGINLQAGVQYKISYTYGNTSVDMSSLSKGTYFVKVKMKDTVSTFKVVKQ